MINQEKAEQALNYLAETDEEYAELYREAKILDKSEKRILAIGFCNANDKTAAAREHRKYLAKEYNEWLENYAQVVEKYELMKAKRDRARITIDFWRSLNANRRQGHV